MTFTKNWPHGYRVANKDGFTAPARVVCWDAVGMHRILVLHERVVDWRPRRISEEALWFKEDGTNAQGYTLVDAPVPARCCQAACRGGHDVTADTAGAPVPQS